jgi:hypothetical protein
MDDDRREVEGSFEHGGASFRMWLHLPHDIWGKRIEGVVAATATRMTPDPPAELVNRSGSPHLFLSAQSLDDAMKQLEHAIKSGDLVDSFPHSVRPDSPGDGA